MLRYYYAGSLITKNSPARTVYSYSNSIAILNSIIHNVNTKLATPYRYLLMYYKNLEKKSVTF